MQEYFVKIKNTVLQIVTVGIIICISAYYTGYAWCIPGFILGIFTSILYFLLMCYRIYKTVDMPAQQALSYMKLGWVLRLSFIIMMLLISLRVPVINFGSSVIGMFTLQMVMFLNALVLITKSFLVPSPKKD